MVTTLTQITLEAFLASPNIDDESPAWELINLVAVQKPRFTLFHSRLQKRLLAIINPSTQRYEALPELRCVLATGSVMPDVTVILKEDLPPMNQAIEGASDWIIGSSGFRVISPANV